VWTVDWHAPGAWTGATVAAAKELAEVPREARRHTALRCPLCLGALTIEPERASCKGSVRSYLVVGEVPILLEEAASSA
jgi:uncharacterized protein YbaR (Trm112 family)